MIPRPQAFLTCLRRLEDKLHTRGWDEPARSAFIYGNQDGSVTHGPAFELPAPKGWGPGDVVVGTALSIASNPIAFPNITNPRRLAGLSFTVEAWWNDDETLHDRPPGVSLADIPGSYEVRMLTAVAGDELLERVYTEALERGYKWHEFGDVNLLLHRLILR